MTQLPRRIRGLLIALAILALSAGVASAARPAFSTPEAAADGLERATEASGIEVPRAGPPEANEPVTDEDEDEPEEPIAEEPAEENGDGAEAAEPDNHGAAVSEAAQADTPEEFDNHGQYVRSVATDNHGHDPERATGKARAERVKPTR
jgi:hypothetical protein